MQNENASFRFDDKKNKAGQTAGKAVEYPNDDPENNGLLRK